MKLIVSLNINLELIGLIINYFIINFLNLIIFNNLIFENLNYNGILRLFLKVRRLLKGYLSLVFKIRLIIIIFY